ncbi:4846_t:CDS:1, partial [Dentiscutata erythropus]
EDDNDEGKEKDLDCDVRENDDKDDKDDKDEKDENDKERKEVIADVEDKNREILKYGYYY